MSSDAKQLQPKVEILAPGGDEASVKAAILAGADAVYCGISSFNARKRATNLNLKKLEELIKIAHQKGTRVYLTLNTLITDSEFEPINSLLNSIREIGIDAVIVQDPGLLLYITNYFPDIETHASTQMNTHNRGQVEFLSGFRVSQLNLSRELSLEEIRLLTEVAHNLSVKTEVFVHGAYCISFSGQCYMSSAMCGESGNRGACVQPCRRYYSTKRDGKKISPLNLKDNSAFPHAGKLIDAGIDSLKIEGRIKNHLYVHTTVEAWKNQVNSWLRSRVVKPWAPELSTVFNRNFSAGYLENSINRDMFIDNSRDQSLEMVSKISGYSADQKVLHLEREPHLAEGREVIIYKPDFTFICRGTIGKSKGKGNYSFKIEHKLRDKIKRGYILYGLPENRSLESLETQIEALQPQQTGVKIALKGTVGSVLEGEFYFNKKILKFKTDSPLSKAKNCGVDEDSIRNQLEKFGGTDFYLEQLDLKLLSKDLFIPRSFISSIKKEFLNKAQKKPQNQIFSPFKTEPPLEKEPIAAFLIDSSSDIPTSASSNSIFLLELPVDLNHNWEKQLEIFHKTPRLIPWFPPILIGDNYKGALKFLKSLKPELLISDNSGIGHEAGKLGIPWVAGPMLNITNSFSIKSFHQESGCKGAFLSGELSREQIQNVSPPQSCGLWYKVFSPMLLMNTRQCLIRNSQQCNKYITDEECIRECNRTAVIYDEKGKPFYINKRPGQYNQVYNGKHFFNISITRDLSRRFTTFVGDIRSIRTDTESFDPKDFVKLFEQMIQGEKEACNRLEGMFKKVTRAQYTRGLH